MITKIGRILFFSRGLPFNVIDLIVIWIVRLKVNLFEHKRLCNSPLIVPYNCIPTFSFTSHGHVVHAFSFIGFRRRQRGYFHGNHWSCGSIPRFTSIFKFFFAFLLFRYFLSFYTDGHPRGGDETIDKQGNFTMKHPIKNGREMCTRDRRNFSRNVFTKVMFYRKRQGETPQQFVFKTNAARGE